jgi:hypothetical protein
VAALLCFEPNSALIWPSFDLAELRSGRTSNLAELLARPYDHQKSDLKV